MHTKMKRTAGVWGTLLVALLGVTVAAAQSGTCNALVTDALNRLSTACSDLGRNQVCYGNDIVDRNFYVDQPVTVFTRPSDVVELSLLARLRTGEFNEERNEWGIAAMRVQPEQLEGVLPGQSALYVMLGNVALVDDSNTQEELAPMQSFFFRGGIGRPECTDAPSTLAIQSDEDVTIDLTVNGLDISLGSLVTLTSPSRSVITLTLHEGTLTTGFPARVVSAGEAIDVTLDENRVFRSVTAPRPATMEELALAVPVTQAIDAVEGTLIASGPVRPPGGSGAGTYTVQRGDNMFRIALNNGTCVSELARTNNIPASQVRSIPVGTVLTLPDGSTCGPFVNDVPVGAVSLPGPFSGGTASGTTPAQTGNETTTTQATDEASTSGEATTTTTDDTGRDTTGETTTTTTTDDTGRDTTTDNTGRDTTGDDTTTGTTTMDDNTIPGTTIIIPGNLFGGDDSDN